jgi:chondroitin AC lyase
MKISFKKIIFAALSVTLFVSVKASDIDVVYQRMYRTYLSNPGKVGVESLLNKMSANGAFTNIDYTTKDGTPRAHLINLTVLASAFENSQNKYFQNAQVRSAYLSGLKFWLKTNHQSSNWWFRVIAYPKELSKSVILMSETIKKDKALFDSTIQYLRWAYERSNMKASAGANGADLIMGAIAASILTRNDQQMLEYKDGMTQIIAIREKDAEGIQPDYMFTQHCNFGRQLYIGNYGKEFINSVLFYFEFCYGTQYNSPGLSTLIDFYKNGVQWVFFSKAYDPSQTGRMINSGGSYGQFESMTKRLLDIGSRENRSELKDIYNHITGDNSLSGNRMFWRCDYMVNRRAGYMTSTRMTSTRTVGNEAGNGAGFFNYYAANGTNYIFTTGKEYNGNYYARFNDRQFPGITAEQDTATLPVPYWGENGGNGECFAGGVSDSTYGACGMELKRRGLTALKSWFYFDEEFVCLGAGINESGGQADVYTTLNQCNLDGKVEYAVNGKISVLQHKESISAPDWVLHGKIGYFNLDPNASFVFAADSGFFTANINHGMNPQNKTYAYLVKPGMQSGKEAEIYRKNLSLTLLSNNENIQAVRHSKLNITEIIFYKAGTLTIGNGSSITSDAPCAVLWNENKNVLTIANPNCESNNPDTIHIKIEYNGKSKATDFKMPVGLYAGISVTKCID